MRRVFADFGANWLEFFPTDVPGATVDDLRAGAFATLPGRGRAASTFRFRLFHAYVNHFGGRYGRVGWVDVRDVYAQGDVFAAAPGEGLAVFTGAGKESELPNFKGSSLGRFPLVLADLWTSDHLSERSRSVDAFYGTRLRGTLTLKRC